MDGGSCTGPRIRSLPAIGWTKEALVVFEVEDLRTLQSLESVWQDLDQAHVQLALKRVTGIQCLVISRVDNLVKAPGTGPDPQAVSESEGPDD